MTWTNISAWSSYLSLWLKVMMMVITLMEVSRVVSRSQFFLPELFTHIFQSDAGTAIAGKYRQSTVRQSTNPGLSNLLTVQMYRNGCCEETFFLTRDQYYQMCGSTT